MGSSGWVRVVISLAEINDCGPLFFFFSLFNVGWMDGWMACALAGRLAM